MTMEELQSQFLELQEKQKTEETARKALEKQLEDARRENEQLLAHNQKLFLKVNTYDVPASETKPDRKYDNLQKVVSDYMDMKKIKLKGSKTNV